MKARVSTTAAADSQVFMATTWWRANRPAAPYLVEEELTAAIAQLEEQPESGTPFPRPKYPDLRKLVLPRTRYFVFYTYDAAKSEVMIRVLWSAWRGRLPDSL